MTRIALALLALSSFVLPADAAEKTYAERLGWPAGSRVVILHSDDLGMHRDGVIGTVNAYKEGVLTSASAMLPCGWIPMWNQWLQENPEFDNGLHLTLTSEWGKFRWGPVAGKQAVPSLVDQEGCLFHSVPEVVRFATPDDVEEEILAQIDRARTMGMPITHLDSHMGTLFGTTEFLDRYVKVGVQEQIPVMIMGGHMTAIRASYKTSQPSALNPNPVTLEAVRERAEYAWSHGLPVLDDLYTSLTSTRDLPEKKELLSKWLREMPPGVAMIILHCTLPSEVFGDVSGSGPNRHSDMQVMMDPDIKALIETEGIILSTWRELKERRDAVKE